MFLSANLDVDDSLDLFVRVAYGLSGEEVQQVLPHDEVEEIHSVLEHCLGLPLAIRACASILRRKRVSSAKELHRKLMRSEQDVFRCREMDEVWRECCKALDPRCLDAALGFAALPGSDGFPWNACRHMGYRPFRSEVHRGGASLLRVRLSRLSCGWRRRCFLVE